MTDEQGLGQSSHVLIHLEKQPQTGTSFNHNMTFLNQPAVKLDVKQSLPKRLSPTSPEKCVVSLQEKPTKGIYHRKTKKQKQNTAPVVTGRIQHEIQHPSPSAPSPICTKKQEAESSHWTLSGCRMLSVLSESPRGGPQIWVWWCWCPGGV